MSQCIHRIFTVNANSSHFAHCDRCNSHAVGASLRPFSAPCSHLRTERKRDSNQYDPFYSSCRSSLSLSSAGAVFLCRFARHELRSVFQGGSRYVLGGGGHSPAIALTLDSSAFTIEHFEGTVRGAYLRLVLHSLCPLNALSSL